MRFSARTAPTQTSGSARLASNVDRKGSALCAGAEPLGLYLRSDNRLITRGGDDAVPE